MSIGYATSTRGGSHHDTRPTLQYAGEHDETTEGTAEFAARSQHFTALGDSLTQCRFVSEGGWGKRVNDRYRDAINLATGWELTTEEVERIGERVYNLERLINVERGVAGRVGRHAPLPGAARTDPGGAGGGDVLPARRARGDAGRVLRVPGLGRVGCADRGAARRTRPGGAGL
ncbi:MAG: aldehyde ferredoxin oxidoreductase C-terminal domain-containing protein, partial [Halobacteriales archaeon]|nr:aldehyde ferredoxin oxidoreductase C-terminal domain-containing protein [Halobacteriales archaeon]